MLKKQYFVYLLFAGILFVLNGCQSSNTIYYWGDYQEVLYNYTQSDKSGYTEQIQDLEKTLFTESKRFIERKHQGKYSMNNKFIALLRTFLGLFMLAGCIQ